MADGNAPGAVNIRSDGQKAYRRNTDNIEIVSKTDKDGIDIKIKPFTKHEDVHIPVVLTKSGFHDMVYNDFFVGEGSEVTIVAGCGIHNCGDCDSSTTASTRSTWRKTRRSHTLKSTTARAKARASAF